MYDRVTILDTFCVALIQFHLSSSVLTIFASYKYGNKSFGYRKLMQVSYGKISLFMEYLFTD